MDTAGRRVLRGGSWIHDEISARADDRSGLTPDFRSYVSGFRLVRASPLPDR